MHIQSLINAIPSIQNVESRINSITSKIDSLSGTDLSSEGSFKSILSGNMESETISGNGYNTGEKLNNSDNAGNNYIADYILNNLDKYSGTTNLNNADIANYINSINQCEENKTVIEAGTVSISEGVGDANLFEGIVALTKKLGEEFGVDSNLINAIVKVESNFNPSAVSKAGAMGLMQLMPATAESLGVENPYDIYENLAGGTKLIKGLLDSFNGDVKLALAAYNAGSARVKECGGVPEIEETKNYVTKVLSIYNPEII